MSLRSIVSVSAIVVLAAFAPGCRESARIGGPWGNASRGGQGHVASDQSEKQAGPSKPPPSSTELAHHPERAATDESGPGAKAGVQLAPAREPSPGQPTGMGGGPSVTGRAGNQFEPASGGHETR